MRDGLLVDESTVTLPKRGADERAPRLISVLTLLSHPSIQRVGERLLLEELLSGGQVPLSLKAPEFLQPARPGARSSLTLA